MNYDLYYSIINKNHDNNLILFRIINMVYIYTQSHLYIYIYHLLRVYKYPNSMKYDLLFLLFICQWL